MGGQKLNNKTKNKKLNKKPLIKNLLKISINYFKVNNYKYSLNKVITIEVKALIKLLKNLKLYKICKSSC